MNPNDLDDDLDEEASTEYTMQSLYERVIMEDDIIITVDEANVEIIKKALKSIKGKANSRLKENDMPIDNSRIKFTELRDSATRNLPVGVTRLQITLVKPKTVPILAIEPAGDF